MGIGDGGLGIGPNPQSPIPNPQSPIPNPHNHNPKNFISLNNFLKIIKFNYLSYLSLSANAKIKLNE